MVSRPQEVSPDSEEILHDTVNRREAMIEPVGDGPVSRVRCGPVPIHAPTPRAAVKIIDDRSIESLKVG